MPNTCPHCQSDVGYYEGPNGKDRCYGEDGDDFFSTRGDKKADLLYGGDGNNLAAADLIDHLDNIAV